jgi:hypothetical protein
VLLTRIARDQVLPLSADDASIATRRGEGAILPLVCSCAGVGTASVLALASSSVQIAKSRPSPR